MSKIDEMLKTPGVYVIVTYLHVCIVEVDEAGNCEQLAMNQPGLPKDGVLPRDGWKADLEPLMAINGPLLRAPTLRTL